MKSPYHLDFAIKFRSVSIVAFPLVWFIFLCLTNANIVPANHEISRIDNSTAINGTTIIANFEDDGGGGGGHRSSAMDSSNKKDNLPSRMSTLLKILKIIVMMTSAMNLTSTTTSAPALNHQHQNQSLSESRSISSWLGFGRRLQSINRNQPPPSSDYGPIEANVPKPLSHGFIPITPPNTRYPAYEKPSTELNPFELIPTIADTTLIDYWLKILEDSKLDEQIIPMLFDEKPDANPSKKSKSKFKNNQRGFNDYRLTRKKVHNFKNYNSNRFLGQNDIGHDLQRLPQRSKKITTKQHHNHHQQQQQQQVFNEYDSSPRCDKFTEDICIDDFEYPEHAILDEISKRKNIFQLMYAEVNSDVPLVDGIPKDLDESFSQDYYYSNNDNNETDDYDGYTPGQNDGQPKRPSLQFDFGPDESNQPQNDKKMAENSFNPNDQNGYVCRSEVLYAKPKLARNLKQKWRVIVNAGDYTQTIRMEKCYRANSECRFIAGHKYASRCVQVNSIHRLLVFEKGKGFYIDSFRIPTACTCHIYSIKQQPALPMIPNQSVESSSSIKRFKNQSKNPSGAQVPFWPLSDYAPEEPSEYTEQYHPSKNHGLDYEELMKILPQLTSIESDRLLQKLFEGLSTTETTTRNAQILTNQLKTPSDALHHLSFSDKFLNEQQPAMNTNNGHVPMVNAHPGLTSILTPPSGQAPVVQVIHMPVSTGLVTVDQMDNGFPGKQLNTIRWPIKTTMDHGDLGPTIPQYSRYWASASDNSFFSQSRSQSNIHSVVNNGNKNVTTDLVGGKTTTDIVIVSGNNDNNNSTEATTTTTTNSPGQTAENEEKNEQQKDGVNKSKVLNKKINFSYHPILEYIVN